MNIYILGTILPCLFFRNKNGNVIVGEKRYNITNLLAVAVFIFYFMISSFRAVSVGNDLVRYAERFVRIGKTPWPDIFKLGDTWGFEYGYVLFCKLLSLFSSNPRILIVASSLFIIGSFYRAIAKYSENPMISMYLFHLFGFYITSFNLIRLLMAVSICLWAIDSIKERKIATFSLIVMVAMFFHTSAIVFFAAYVTPKLKTNKTMFLFSCLIGCITYGLSKYITILMTYVLSGAYQGYRTEVGAGSGNGLLLWMCFILVFAYLNQKGKRDYDYNMWVNFIFIVILFNILALNLTTVSRLIWYFKVALLFLIPRISNGLRKKSNSYEKIIFDLGAYIAPWYFYIPMIMSKYLAVMPYVFGL